MVITYFWIELFFFFLNLQKILEDLKCGHTVAERTGG